MNPVTKALGVALIIIGIGLAYWGLQISESVTSQLTKSISGALPDAVMYRYIGGAACAVAGLFLVARG